jgi:hypothetical protein
MSAFKVFLTYAAGRPATGTLILCCLAALAVSARTCPAQSFPEDGGNQTLLARFICLKPGNSIAPACLTLQPDKTVGFSIDDTSLVNVQGMWSQGPNSFSAHVSFAVDKQTSFHYRLDFKGYRLKDLYGGRAYLFEYDRSERLFQKIIFLFYAVPPGTLAGREKDTGQ